MSTIETLAAKLAIDTLAAMDATGDDKIHTEIGTVLGASSQSMEESFLTEIRVRLADRVARKALARRVAAAQAKQPPADPA